MYIAHTYNQFDNCLSHECNLYKDDLIIIIFLKQKNFSPINMSTHGFNRGVASDISVVVVGIVEVVAAVVSNGGVLYKVVVLTGGCWWLIVIDMITIRHPKT